MRIPQSFRSALILFMLATGGSAAAAQPVPNDTAAASATVQALASSTPSGGEPAPLETRLARTLRIGSAQAVPLVIDNRPGLPMRVTVEIEGIPHELDLRPFSIRAPSYQVLVHRPDDSLESIAPPTDCTLRGEITGLPGSVVAGGVLDDGLYATIILPGGDRWWLQPAESLVDDPDLVTSDILPGPALRTHVLFRAGNPTESVMCSTVDAVTPDTTGGGGGGGMNDRGLTHRAATLAIDAEFAFFLKTGSVQRTVSILNTVINITNVQYEREIGIRHQVGAIIVRTFQVYSIGDPTTSLLNQFRNRWNANHTSVIRDVAMLIDGNGVGGQAFTGTVCNLTNAYAGCGMDWTNIGYRCDVAAHELGHTWGACHCPCASPAFTMNPSITFSNRFFQAPASDCGPNTISQITTFRNSRTCLSALPRTPVPNDNCASAVDLPCSTDDIFDGCSFGINNIEATLDGPTSTADCTNFMRTDIWYRWVPRCDAAATINTCVDASFDTMIAVYAGSCPSDNSTMVACNDDNGPTCTGLRASVSFQATAGTPYLIRIGGFNGAQGGGIFEIRWVLGCPRPSNDRCSTPITVQPGQDRAFDNRGAQTGQWVQPGNGIPRDSWTEFLCSGSDDSQITNDLWYRFVAPCSGVGRFSLCGSSFDTKLALYSECPSMSHTALACNDDSGPACNSLSSSIDHQLLAGNTYIVRVGGYHGQTGTGTLRIDMASCPPTPANDACSGAIAVGVGTTPFDTTAATADGGDACFNETSGGSLWYRYTPSLAGTATVSLCNNNYAERLTIYPTGSCSAIGPGAPTLSCSGATCDNIPTFTTTPGQTYLICISGRNGQSGTGNLVIGFTAFLTGACCRPDSTCLIANSFGCSFTGGTYQGNGTLCTVPTNRCCPADFNGSGTVTVQDIFDFLTAYFASDPRADFNVSGGTTIQDLFDFLAAYFTGCA